MTLAWWSSRARRHSMHSFRPPGDRIASPGTMCGAISGCRTLSLASGDICVCCQQAMRGSCPFLTLPRTFAGLRCLHFDQNVLSRRPPHHDSPSRIGGSLALPSIGPFRESVQRVVFPPLHRRFILMTEFLSAVSEGCVAGPFAYFKQSERMRRGRSAASGGGQALLPQAFFSHDVPCTVRLKKEVRS